MSTGTFNRVSSPAERAHSFWKASFDFTTQLLCVPSSTQVRKAELSSPSTFLARSSSFVELGSNVLSSESRKNAALPYLSRS